MIALSRLTDTATMKINRPLAHPGGVRASLITTGGKVYFYNEVHPVVMRIKGVDVNSLYAFVNLETGEVIRCLGNERLFPVHAEATISNTSDA